MQVIYDTPGPSTAGSPSSTCKSPETDIQVIRRFEQKLKAMRPTTQEDLEDVQLVLERMNSIPEPITLEELMTLDDTTQEDN